MKIILSLLLFPSLAFAAGGSIDSTGMQTTVGGDDFSVGGSSFVVDSGVVVIGSAAVPSDPAVFNRLIVVSTAPGGDVAVLLRGSGGATNFTAFTGRISGGTNDNPTATLSGTLMANFGGAGHTGSAWVTNSTSDCGSVAEELFSSTAFGTGWRCRVTANAGTTKTERFRISNAGFVGIGTSAPATKLQVSSGVVTIDGTSSGFTVGGGSVIVRSLKIATGSTDLGGAITANCTAETNFSITGVAVGDACLVNTPAAIASTDWIVCRTLVDNVALKYCSQGVGVDPAAMVYHITTFEY